MGKRNTEFEEKTGKTVFCVCAMASKDAKASLEKKLLKMMIDDLLTANEKFTT